MKRYKDSILIPRPSYFLVIVWEQSKTQWAGVKGSRVEGGSRLGEIPHFGRRCLGHGMRPNSCGME